MRTLENALRRQADDFQVRRNVDEGCEQSVESVDSRSQASLSQDANRVRANLRPLFCRTGLGRSLLAETAGEVVKATLPAP